MKLSRSGLRTSLGAAVLAASVSLAPTVVYAGPATAPAASAALSNIHIDNFGEVSAAYFRGGQPKGHDFQDLAAAGVKMVIDLAAEGDPAEGANAQNAGMHFVRIPMTTHAIPTPGTIAKFLSLVSDPANQPVYVHCIGGRHRTGVMTAIYRMTTDGWTPAQAFTEMKQFKFGADFLHQEFKDFVYSYADTAHAAYEAVSHKAS